MDGRLFGLDIQLVFDALVLFVMLAILVFILSKLFFKPVREYIEKRNEKIEQDKKVADEENQEALQLKGQYQEKLKDVRKEAENQLSISRKQALKKQDEMIAQAKEEASTIMKQANQQATFEKMQIQEDVKQEIISLALDIANQFVDIKADHQRVSVLLEETLKEMGDDA